MTDGTYEAIARGTVVEFARSVCRTAAALDDGRLLCRRFEAAGLAIEARFSDAALAGIYLDRIDHRLLDNAAKPPDLKVDVLSSDRIKGFPLARWGDGHCSVAEFDRTFAATELRSVYPHLPGFWQFFIPGARYGVQLSATQHDLPPWDAGAPLRLHLHWALAAQGRRLVHGATLGLDGAGVLLIGAGGAGKSGTTMAGVAAGLQTVGDDYVVVDSEPVVARRIFRIAKLDRPGLARLGTLATGLHAEPDNWQGKVEFDLDRLRPGAVTDRIALRALLMPKIGSVAATTISPMSVSEAMRALTFANLYQIPNELESGVRFFGLLARRLPAFHLHLSNNLAEIGQVLRNFIATRSAA